MAQKVRLGENYLKTAIRDKNSIMYNQLSSASCAEPFSFLGPFLAPKQGYLRVWMPGADKVEVILDGETRLALEREGSSGFILRHARDLSKTYYQLAVSWPDSEQIPP